MQTHTSAPLEIARRYWGMTLVRGVIAILFGLLAMLWPHLTYNLFMYVFGVFAILQGVSLLTNAYSQYNAHTQRKASSQWDAPAQRAGYSAQEELVRDSERLRAATASQRTTKSWTTLLVEGALSILCGLLALILPGVVGALALYAVAAWALFTGIGALMQTRTHGWVLGVVGALAVFLFLIVLVNPLGIIHSFLWIIGLFSLLMGILLVVRGVQHNLSGDRGARPLEPTY